MPQEFKLPEDDEQTLHIDGESSKSFGEIFSRMTDHFGVDIRLDQFEIDVIRFVHEDGCSCCRGSGTYGLYLRIERQGHFKGDTEATPITSLIVE